MNAIQDKRIAVVGGGPGGLTLARLLQMQGADVKVYDRDHNRDARVQGATLDLHTDSGLLALAEAGLMEAFQTHYRPGADTLRIYDQQAALILDENGYEGLDSTRPEIDRGPLRKLLLDSLRDGTAVWDSHFVSMSREPNDTWLLTFRNGTTAVADLVIAADGANSRIRPYITPVQAIYSGVTIVEGAVYDSENRVPEIHAMLNGGKIFTIGDSKTLIISSKGDGSLVFYTGCNTAEEWVRECGVDFSDKAQVVSWFRKEFAEWNSIWVEMFEKAEPVFTPRPQYYMPLDQDWEPLPDLTMLGDAAHVMPPYAGEGVNMAMLDALELSRTLTDPAFQDSRSAIATYERGMRERASEITEMTLDSTRALHAPGAIEFLINVLNPE
nr:NAD(P)/FAD-dependent oxidoreductase [uncultured Dyadobacter sp.]